MKNHRSKTENLSRQNSNFRFVAESRDIEDCWACVELHQVVPIRTGGIPPPVVENDIIICIYQDFAIGTPQRVLKYLKCTVRRLIECRYREHRRLERGIETCISFMPTHQRSSYLQRSNY